MSNLRKRPDSLTVDDRPTNMIKCEECGLMCSGKSHYNVHARSHTGERPYTCHICGFGFTQKGNLRRHFKIHSDDKPYKCPLCNYKCRRHDALNGHLRIHSDQRPYRCGYCQRSYKSRQSMKEHEYQCTKSQKKSNPENDSKQEEPYIYNPIIPFQAKQLSLFPYLYPHRYATTPSAIAIPDFSMLNQPMQIDHKLSVDIVESTEKTNSIRMSPNKDGYDNVDTTSDSEKTQSNKKMEHSTNLLKANGTSETVDTDGEIKVYQNGTLQHFWKCDFCKCIFLDECMYSFHMRMHLQQAVIKWKSLSFLEI